MNNDILNARRRVLSASLPNITQVDHHNNLSQPLNDSDHCSLLSFYQTRTYDTKVVPPLPPPTVSSNVVSQTKSNNLPLQTGVAIAKPGRRPRFTPNWTDQMDRTIRKMLSKHGWGCWKKIAQSGKLPPEYHRKLISNRAKALRLTPHMFGPQVVSTNATTTPKNQH